MTIHSESGNVILIYIWYIQTVLCNLLVRRFWDIFNELVNNSFLYFCPVFVYFDKTGNVFFIVDSQAVSQFWKVYKTEFHLVNLTIKCPKSQGFSNKYIGTKSKYLAKWYSIIILQWNIGYFSFFLLIL